MGGETSSAVAVSLSSLCASSALGVLGLVGVCTAAPSAVPVDSVADCGGATRRAGGGTAGGIGGSAVSSSATGDTSSWVRGAAAGDSGGGRDCSLQGKGAMQSTWLFALLYFLPRASCSFLLWPLCNRRRLELARFSCGARGSGGYCLKRLRVRQILRLLLRCCRFLLLLLHRLPLLLRRLLLT